MNVEKVLAILEGISLGLARMIEILAPIFLMTLLGILKGLGMAASIAVTTKKREKLKKLTSNQDEI